MSFNDSIDERVRQVVRALNSPYTSSKKLKLGWDDISKFKANISGFDRLDAMVKRFEQDNIDD